MSSFDPKGDVVAEMRAMMEAGGVFGQSLVDAAEERTIPGPAGDIPIRVFVPPTVDAVYLSIHGGAFMMGSRRQQRPDQLARSREECNVAVVSPEYRMAPEHQYPAGHDDCEAVAMWLLEHGAGELGSDRLLIGGESAGGHIAAVTVLRLRDRHDAADRLRGANLNCGVYDITGTPSRHLPPPENDVLAAGAGSGDASSSAGTYFAVGHQPARPRRLTPLRRPPRSVPGAVHRRHRRHAARRQRVHGRALGAGRQRDRARGVPAGPHGVTGSASEMGRRAQARVEDFIRAHAKG